LVGCGIRDVEECAGSHGFGTVCFEQLEVELVVFRQVELRAAVTTVDGDLPAI
jgi:hypothetical protein